MIVKQLLNPWDRKQQKQISYKNKMIDESADISPNVNQKFFLFFQKSIRRIKHLSICTHVRLNRMDKQSKSISRSGPENKNMLSACPILAHVLCVDVRTKAIQPWNRTAILSHNNHDDNGDDNVIHSPKKKM